MSKKRFIGKVVSEKMTNTVVVAVEMPKKHPFYQKIIKNTRRFMAANQMQSKLGDSVVIEETKPVSKKVTWVVVEILANGGNK